MTPKGTQDPNRRRIKSIPSPATMTLDDYERQFGIRPKALPGSGHCMSCGEKLVPPPAGPDRDHAVCSACFPEDLKEEWEGRQVDYVRADLDAGTIEEIEFPKDPFVEADNG